MKSILSNKWTKRCVSVIASLYTAGVCILSYFSIFYNIYVESKVSLCLLVSAVSVIALVLMLYTRNQLLTKISSFLILFAMIPVVLLYFSEKALLIPIVATGIIILLMSGAGEGKKTLFGTIILLLYIFGALGYFLFTSFFVTHAKTEVIQDGESPSKLYRYKIVNTEDTSGGSTAVYIEPNTADLQYPFVTFKLKNMERICYMERPISGNVEIQWATQSRSDITSQLGSISEDIMVTLSDDELEQLGYTKDNTFQLSGINVYKRMEIGLTASDVAPLKLDSLTDEELAVFDIGRESDGKYFVLEPTDDLYLVTKKESGEKIYLSELNKKGISEFNYSHLNDYGYTLFELERDTSVPLSSLNDVQLGMLGVSDEGDVLAFNGKICFRFYVAEIEDYFDTESRKLSIDLLS
ncbi:MAG: hypothetical protein K2N49_05050 [Ruminococcus sp.]|nr:hypothetical protein [Ruminococcus sp.]MDE7226207.1 hypothetical protein [Ruminococcus sp.]